jgi:hypothetical protein
VPLYTAFACRRQMKHSEVAVQGLSAHPSVHEILRADGRRKYDGRKTKGPLPRHPGWPIRHDPRHPAKVRRQNSCYMSLLRAGIRWRRGRALVHRMMFLRTLQRRFSSAWRPAAPA